MTATTIKQIEGAPPSYDTPYGLSVEAQPFVDAAWGRVEAYIAWRWPMRSVSWIVESDCDSNWRPPLRPVTIATTEIWRNEAWETTTLSPAPIGYCLPAGTFRIVGTAGDDSDPPEIVDESVRRLAEYMGATAGTDGAGLRSENVDGVWQGEFDNRAKARAMVDSGCADLLRTYRRA